MEPAKIIARYSDGRLVKGCSQDFKPNSPAFHLFEDGGNPSNEAHEIRISDLKAVFFVKTLEGDPNYRERKEFTEGDRCTGRKVEVTFKDGEVLQGSTLGYNPNLPGFFLFPPDPSSNNIRVFVVSATLENFRYL